MIHSKRIYDEPGPNDGYRILVDRLWPRGISKERAALNLWLKEIAPSSELRTWFSHKPERFAEFSHKYTDELANNSAALGTLKALVKKHSNITLLYGAKDPVVNHAVVLQAFLEHRSKK